MSQHAHGDDWILVVAPSTFYGFQWSVWMHEVGSELGVAASEADARKVADAALARLREGRR